MSADRSGSPLLLIAHPSPDVYGSDRQLLETIDGVREAGWRVDVVLPAPGPLVELLEDRGARVRVESFPVLRKSLLKPLPLVKLIGQTIASVIRLVRQLRRDRPAALYVNTVTIPVWLLAGLFSRTPSLSHVHEAEEDQPRLVSAVLALPLLLARDIVVNSEAAARVLEKALPRLRRKVTVVHNGVASPADAPAPVRDRVPGDPAEIALVGRLSPRKGTDVALDAVAELRSAGRDVHLTLCGSVFAGYEWYEAQLRERAAEPDLNGAVTFAGYVNPTWPVLAAADIVLVPSRTEPFGNAAVEGLLARRPVIASGVQGLCEVLKDGETGILVPAGDPAALAAAIASLLDDPARARELAETGLADALDRFSLPGYRANIVDALRRTVR